MSGFGNRIHVLDTDDYTLKACYIHGINKAKITSIAFNKINTYFALISENNIVHIYKLPKLNENLDCTCSHHENANINVKVK